MTYRAGFLCATLVVSGLAGCIGARPRALASVNPAGYPIPPSGRVEAPASLDSQVTRAIEARIVDLKARGGDCASYAAVLESSYRAGQIKLRPFMWRVGSQLASGEAKPNGDMVLAREIDSLNVGVRTIDDLLATMEHEAVHITFKVENDITTDRADEYVRACRQRTSVSP